MNSLKKYYEYLKDPTNNLSNKSQHFFLSAAKHCFKYIFKKIPDFFNYIKRYEIQKALKELKFPKTQNKTIVSDYILLLIKLML